MISRIFRSVFFTTILVLILGLGASLFISSYQLIKADSDGLISFTTKLEDALNKNPSMDLTLLTIDDYRINLIHKDGSVYFDSQVNASTLENHSDRDELLNLIWGIDYDGENRTVDVHIRALRSKLGELENVIQTVRGIGYKADA